MKLLNDYKAAKVAFFSSFGETEMNLSVVDRTSMVWGISQTDFVSSAKLYEFPDGEDGEPTLHSDKLRKVSSNREYTLVREYDTFYCEECYYLYDNSKMKQVVKVSDDG